MSHALGGPSRHWWSLVFLGKPLTGTPGTHKHPFRPSDQLLAKWQPHGSSAANLCILGRWEDYFVSTGTKTWHLECQMQFPFPETRGLRGTSVMRALGPKRRARNRPPWVGRCMTGTPAQLVLLCKEIFPGRCWNIAKHGMSNWGASCCWQYQRMPLQ